MSKTYTEGMFIKTFETQFGEIYKISFNVEMFTKWLKKNQNDKGFVNIDMLKRRELGKYGDSHYCTLDEWKPENKELGKPLNQQEGGNFEHEDDGLPF